MAAQKNPPKFDDQNPFYIPPTNPVDGPARTMRPFIYTPMTKWSEHWFSHADSRCSKYEELLLKCAYQGSRRQMEQKCIKELEDFEECLFKPKQIARWRAITKEREKQGKYEELPPSDIFWERHAR